MLTLIHDVPSCASLLAVLRLQALADEGLAVTFVGVDLRGFAITLPVTSDVQDDFVRTRDRVRELGLDPRPPQTLPPTVAVHAVQEAADDLGLGAPWRGAVYRAYWEDAADLGNVEVLVSLGRAVGLSDAVVRDAATDASLHAALRRRWNLLRGRGVGGVPVLEVGGAFVDPAMPEDDLRSLASL